MELEFVLTWSKMYSLLLASFPAPGNNVAPRHHIAKGLAEQLGGWGATPDACKVMLGL